MRGDTIWKFEKLREPGLAGHAKVGDFIETIGSADGSNQSNRDYVNQQMQLGTIDSWVGEILKVFHNAGSCDKIHRKSYFQRVILWSPTRIVQKDSRSILNHCHI